MLDVRRLPGCAMQRMTTLPVLLAMFAVPSFGLRPCQNSEAPVAFQSRTLTAGCDDCQQDPSEVFIDLRASGLSGFAAFRICTAEPLPVALFVGRQPWALALEMVDTYPDVTANRILILRSTRCERAELRSQVETWGVPAGASLPFFEEGIRLSQLRVEDAWANRGRSKTTFKLVLAEAAKAVSSSASSYLVVRGYFWRRQSAAMRANLAVARRFIEGHGIDRGHVRLMPSLNAYWGKGSTTYPDVYVVHLDGTLDVRSVPSSTAPN